MDLRETAEDCYLVIDCNALVGWCNFPITGGQAYVRILLGLQDTQSQSLPERHSPECAEGVHRQRSKSQAFHICSSFNKSHTTGTIAVQMTYLRAFIVVGRLVAIVQCLKRGKEGKWKGDRMELGCYCITITVDPRIKSFRQGSLWESNLPIQFIQYRGHCEYSATWTVE